VPSFSRPASRCRRWACLIAARLSRRRNREESRTIAHYLSARNLRRPSRAVFKKRGCFRCRGVVCGPLPQGLKGDEFLGSPYQLMAASTTTSATMPSTARGEPRIREARIRGTTKDTKGTKTSERLTVVAWSPRYGVVSRPRRPRVERSGDRSTTMTVPQRCEATTSYPEFPLLSSLDSSCPLCPLWLLFLATVRGGVLPLSGMPGTAGAKATRAARSLGARSRRDSLHAHGPLR